MENDICPEVEWVIIKGDDCVMSGEYANDDGTPEPLTGCDLEVTIWDKLDGRMLLKLTSTPAAGISINESAGLYSITVTDTQSASFDISRGYYFVKLKNADGDIRTLYRGPAVIVPAPVWGVT